MAKSYIEVNLMGNVGNDPEIKTMQSGDRVANFSVATSESWKDKATGERKEKTEWHRVVVFNQGLVKIIEQYLTKGAKVQIRKAELATRSWEKDGEKRYTTEIVLGRFNGELDLLDHRREAGGFASPPQQDEPPAPSASDYFGPAARTPINELEDEIPF